MKKGFISLSLVVGLAFLGGCSRKKSKSEDKSKMTTAQAEFYQFDEEAMAFADASGAVDEDEIKFDEEVLNSLDGGDVFAFDDENKEFTEEEAEDLAVLLADLAEEADLALQEEAVQAIKPVNFAFNSSEGELSEEQVDRAREVLENDYVLRLEGYGCQMAANVEFNDDLAQNRADWVKTQLVAQGLPADRIEAVGCGTERVEVELSEEREERIAQLAPFRRVEFVAYAA